VVIDEAHLVPHDGDGMYRSLIGALRQAQPTMRVCGLTATPFRLDSGRLDQGEGKIFDQTVFEYDIGAGIRDGWLAPLSSKATATSIDTSAVSVRGGEFVAGELENAADAVVAAAVDELIRCGQDRRSWLIFCAGVGHAEHVGEALRERGIAAATVTAETPSSERERIIGAFHCGDIRAVTNVNVLTTGFNVPGVDLIAMLRPTLSTGLYVQMVGRGTRKAPGKTDCKILDFAGNVWRHGPVDRVNIAENGKAAVKSDSVAAKKCPDCAELLPLGMYTCSSCGHEFPKPNLKPKHATVADVVPIMAGAVSWLPVGSVSFRCHIKYSDPSAPLSLRVDYLCGLSTYSEYLSIERQGYAREMAERAWFALGGCAPVPMTVAQALARTDELDSITAITVVRNGRFWNVDERRVRRRDGNLVEVNRHYRCWTARSREEATSIKIPINDEIPW
jgi:DNA repair protein RadD